MKPSIKPSAPASKKRYSYGHARKIKKLVEAYKALRGVTRITSADLRNLEYFVAPLENSRSDQS